jgi:DNA polymerase-3 subunit delta
VTALKATEADSFIANPDPARPVVLVYGPDAGLVRERVEALVRASVDDMADPFSLVRIEADDLSGNPGRLVEEAQTVPLFGGRRAVWLRASGRVNPAPAVEALLGVTLRDCRVIIEAGELRKTAPLRSLCERSKIAVAIPCYPDGERDVARVIEEEMRAEKLSITPDARAALVSLLGGDRLASRAEIRKLALYAHGKDKVELEDVLAVVTDASALSVNNVIDAAFAGKPAETDMQFGKALADGSGAGAIAGAALRWVAQLHKMRLAMDDGASSRDVMFRVPPPIHFSRQSAVENALRNWNAPRLMKTMEQLAQTAMEARRQTGLAQSLVHRALMSLAVNARRRES